LSGTKPLVSFGQAQAHDARSHEHHHHPYPHADHPLGPKTLPKVPGRLAREEQGS
jgi:sirohydrochlorin cobaltochelatase